MINVIIIPDIIPNNIKQLRSLRELTIEDLAKGTDLTYSFIQAVENNKANMSGITALKIMEFLDANFYQVFDISKTITLPYSKEIYDIIYEEIDVKKEYLYLNNSRNIIHIEESIDKILQKKNIEGKVYRFKIIKTVDKTDDMSSAYIEIELLKQVYEEKEFDINFLKEINYELFEHLNNKGFNDKKRILLTKSGDYKIDGDYVYILKENLIKKGKPIRNIKKLNKKEVKIKKGNPLKKENPMKIIKRINKKHTKIKYDKNKNIKEISFYIKYQAINNIQYIQDCLKLTNNEVCKALDISRATYNSIKTTNQRLSIKLMWKLVKLFRVPLELIIDIPLYIKTYQQLNT
ncbi:MAG: helix-turn-helix transcriptional regulator [Bacilli bacterium]|nr:helix-turn-helix transcriptional regulator [Bacilli bacterium]